MANAKSLCNMKKNILGIFILLLYISINSCTKKADPAPASNNTSNNNTSTSTAPLHADFNGVTYSAYSLTNLSSYSSWFTASSPFPIAANGSYAAFTFNNVNYTYSGFPYCFELIQMNINKGDTLVYEINVYSSVPIVPGSYQIWADTFYTNDPPVDVKTFATASAFSTTTNSSQYGDSTSVGTITITNLDATNKVATGSFSFINYGYYYKGVVPYVAISNGQFTNLTYQPF